MRIIAIVVAAIVSTLIAVGTVYQLYVLLCRPELSAVPREEVRQWPWWRKAVFWGSVVAAFIGVGYMIYKGAEAALWFIPKNWRRINDDGEFEWVGHGVALMIALFGTLAFFGKLNAIAEEKARKYWSTPPSQR